MSRTVMLIPTGSNVDLANVGQSVINAIEKQGIKYCVFNPVAQPEKQGRQSVNQPLTICQVEKLLASNNEDVLLEDIVAQYYACANSVDTVLIEGIVATNSYPFANELNYSIAKTLGADIVLVVNAEGLSADEFANKAAVACANFGGIKNEKISGVIAAGNAAAEIKQITKVNVLGVNGELCSDWIKTLSVQSNDKKLSPPAFRYKLTELARKANKVVVLPEGDEPRTVKAAAICAERKIAKCVLLANPADVERVAKEQGVTLGEGVEIINPESVREDYVARFVELRKSKGLTEDQARAQLADNVVLGTLMLEQGKVDGLVSGAVHTTANTIRPPLQLIKTAPGSSLVSSVFFMLMPDQVYLYGDCAINPNPTAADLAEIAIQSADTAIAFDIEPRVAMLSYSTGTSGQGVDVELVKEATRIAQEKRPDLLIDGPLQYDAAVMADVAKSKAPDSKVAGKANVFIFPSLNTGNIAYKAVQRSADLVSVGPMLQGMRKPVNDLSRGALVDDIVYTIALTAIQATQ